MEQDTCKYSERQQNTSQVDKNIGKDDGISQQGQLKLTNSYYHFVSEYLEAVPTEEFLQTYGGNFTLQDVTQVYAPNTNSIDATDNISTRNKEETTNTLNTIIDSFSKENIPAILCQDGQNNSTKLNSSDKLGIESANYNFVKCPIIQEKLDEYSTSNDWNLKNDYESEIQDSRMTQEKEVE